MSTPSIPDSQRLLALEKHAEQWALTILRGATFTDCLKINGIAPTCEIVTPEGKTVTIRGSDVYDHRTWKKFLASINQDEDIYQLTDVKEHLANSTKRGCFVSIRHATVPSPPRPISGGSNALLLWR